jgi:hypothetical protein
LSQVGENAFKAALRETIALFKLEEEVIRADYKRKVEKGSEPGGSMMWTCSNAQRDGSSSMRYCEP